MSQDFAFDVFLSHSSRDKSIVRPLAARLRADGVRVWFDEWEIKPGDSIFSKVEEGLEQSRVLVLCMSKNAFGSDWATLESQTFRFRDPLNKERRFIPLRLDNAEIKGTLAQFLYINWQGHEREYKKLIQACIPPEKYRLRSSEITKLVNLYIGVDAGYLGDFSYRTHKLFYAELDLDIDPEEYEGTTRQRFIKILEESNSAVQAKILEGILDRFPEASSELRTQERCNEIRSWICRLKAHA